MSTKALKRELFAAIVMLLVAAIALSGSTFAWFANNTVVDAGKVTVAAQTSKNLAIAPGVEKDPTSNKFKTSANIDENVTTSFYAVTAAKVDGSGNRIKAIDAAIGSTNADAIEGVKFFSIASDNKVLDPNKADATTSFGAALLIADDADFAKAFVPNTTDVWTTSVSLLYTAAADSGNVDTTAAAIVSVATERAIDHALHIAVLASDGAWTVVDMPADTPVANEAGTAYEYKVDFSRAVASLEPNVPQELKLYIWFDGEDADCTSNKALYSNGMTTTFYFAIQ